MFHLKAFSCVKVKEVVSEVQENCDTTQTVALLDPKEIQDEAKRHGTKYLHLGCIRVGISDLTHKGLNNFVLCTVRDLTHNKFTDSLIGGVVTPLSNGLSGSTAIQISQSILLVNTSLIFSNFKSKPLVSICAVNGPISRSKLEDVFATLIPCILLFYILLAKILRLVLWSLLIP